MDLIQERDRIFEFFKQPLGHQLFRIRKGLGRHLLLDILQNPNGYIELTPPESSVAKSSWNLVVNATLGHLCRLAIHFNVANMTQGFMACVFVISKRLEIEMPPNVIQFDPKFYQQLPYLTPRNHDFQIQNLNMAAQYADAIKLIFLFQ
ncbi:hypothetical protein ACTXT7_009273 [Hymenolepis weldensis]